MSTQLPSELLELCWVPHIPGQEEQCLVTAFGRLSTDLYHKAFPILKQLTGCDLPHEWNDTHTKEEVLAVARLAEMKLGLRPMEVEPEELVEEVQYV